MQVDLFNSKKQKKIFKQKNIYKPVRALSHTPPYKIHKYFARRPWNVFENIIKSFSKENEIILDPFCGGGVTIYEGIKNNRKVVGYDLNPLSIFITSNMLTKGDNIVSLIAAMNKIISFTHKLYDDYYFFKNSEEKIKIEWIETTFEIECPSCFEKTLLSNRLKSRAGYYFCSNQNCDYYKDKNKSFKQSEAKRIGYKYLYLVGKNSDNKKIIKEISSEDLNRLNDHITYLNKRIDQYGLTIKKDKIPENWDRQLEDGLKQKNIIYFQDLFTKRNLLINNLLINFIKSLKKTLTQNDYFLLRIAFSNTVKETNIMSFTNDSWQGGKPTTWSKHAYWIPSQFCEVNILSSLINSFKRVKDSMAFNQSKKYEVHRAKSFDKLTKERNLYLKNRTKADDSIQKNSIDLIVTDPPYGSNVQYLELSHFWYVWNQDIYEKHPDFTLEAISNRKKSFEGAKNMYTYEANLFKVFKKSFHTLKPNKHMVLTFNNKDFSAWLALLFSIFRSGFSLKKDGIYFQDGVENYKQTSHTKYDGAPFGDFIYVFVKRENRKIKSYDNENSFYNDLKALFLKNSKLNFENKYDWMMFYLNESIPLIESFSKSYLEHNDHTLYENINKNFLKNFY